MCMESEKLKRYFETANINFLIGSGLSCPYLKALGKIETWLSEVDSVEERAKKCVKASIYSKFFTDVIEPNLPEKKEGEEYHSVLDNYKKFVSTIHKLIVLRNSPYGLTKQINIFTTNIDDFFETAFEESGVEWNAGFSGLLHPEFNENNFGKTYNVSSRIFSRKSELPLFNLFKIHGSVNWMAESKRSRKVLLDAALSVVKNVVHARSLIEPHVLCCIDAEDDISRIEEKATSILDEYEEDTTCYDSFLEAYEKLVIINPSKKKFSETVLDSRFYELMRLYSNSLEKTNSVLFVHGFSFADEHLAQMTMRAADSNPTLQIFVFAYKEDEIQTIKNNLHLENTTAKNNNVEIITPDNEFSFDKINKLYEGALSKI